MDCLVMELRVQRIDGMSLLRRAREKNPGVCAVVIAGTADIAQAVEAMRQGAADFQVKPLNHEKLLTVLRHGLEHQALAARVVEMESQLDERFGFERLTGRSRAIVRVMEQVRHIAATRATVLIEGETGTGKGLVAQAIHQNSPRKGERFVWVNCGALAEGVIEGELFGHERGELAGSSGSGRGRFELADGGTLFLDEIGELPPAIQVKLLRAMQDRSFERVGGTETIRTDVRLVAATSRDLAAEVGAGRFREDLFCRLGVVRIQMPPLRERPEDIPLLVERFVREFNREHGRRVAGVTRGVLDRLMRHPWPGNVRELRNTVEGMAVFARGRRALDLSDLPDRLREVESAGEKLELRVGMTVDEAERRLIAATLRHAGNDKPRAAAMLGIGLRTLYRKLRRYSLD
ncbi:MAG: sigma-54-dependent Fis family transcriptional regulator [Candidatus Eisenbacteria bacterium]|nr:sigma-54-dependent Fis family transcriptional regulator [Candidatus Eisenbacteria bacterium]